MAAEGRGSLKRLKLREILGKEDPGKNLLRREARVSGLPEGLLLREMGKRLRVMLEGLERCSKEPCVSPSGMVKGLAFKIGRSGLLRGSALSVVKWALAVAESNACMGRIVAAPTAGASGVLPAVAKYLLRRKVGRRKVVLGLFVAGGIGEVIASRASLAGAKHGCQAEVGAASAMGAGMAAYCWGGKAREVESAASIALSSYLGLVCDPVAGLVEVPCVVRNASAALTALFAAEAALSGYRFPIPFDEVVDALREIGERMPESLRETAEGGLAATPTGRRISASLRKKCP